MSGIRFGSCCSGIESASVAFEPLGWSPAWFSEIAPFPCRLLAHRFPNVPNLGDLCGIDPDRPEVSEIDVLIAGTPCQGFSIAGLQGSLSDERSNLALAFCRLARRIAAAGRLRAIVWENVPGCLTTDDNAFGCILAGFVGEAAPLQAEPLPAPGCSGRFWKWSARRGQHVHKWENAGCVYGPEGAAAWRVLDAQYFGVPQRRRRVFVVVCPGNWTDPASILFEREGMRRDSPPRREAGKGFAADVAPCLVASGRGVARIGDTYGQDPVIPCVYGGNYQAGPRSVAAGLRAHHGHHDFESENFVVARVAPTLCVAGKSAAGSVNQQDAENGALVPVAFSSKDDGSDCGEVAPTLRAMGAHQSHDNAGGQLAIASRLGARLGVRRLLPVECERLQGFPDGWTDIPEANGKRSADGPRYRALGNSKAVPVVRWIGKRIAAHLATLQG